jgi:two-component system, NtrC family, nitrogen regulation sensor histidine kinase NtrY
MKGNALFGSRILTRLRLWSRRVGLPRKAAFVLALAAVVSGIATFATMTGWSQLGTDPKNVLILLYLDVILLLLFGGVVSTRVVRMWVDRRRGMAGSALHIRLVVLFSAVAVTPAVLVAVFAALFLNFGVQAWFNEKVSTAVGESRAVARAYLEEHRHNILADAFAMANDLNRNAASLMRNERLFSRVLSSHATFRNLSEALVTDGSGRVMARSDLSLSLEFDRVPPDTLKKAGRGEVVLLTSDSDDRMRAMVKLDRFVDAYLLVGRFVAANVVEHIQRTEAVVSQFKSLEKRRKGIQITFVMIFVVVALLLLMAAVWVGMTMATNLAQPLSNLISAAERVRKGDLGVRVSTTGAVDEIGTLSRAFNRMTSRLERQQDGLMEAYRQLDERRLFTETVLTGVSAGVIGLDAQGGVHLSNPSASKLLRTDLEQSIGRPLIEAVPEMANLLEEARKRPDRPHRAEIRIGRRRRVHTLLVSIVAERVEADPDGFVVTFDDITELLSAQRKAAWANVARRIAHEIKNPLTPIQLSAERLKRKYLGEIQSDPETFVTCTETIVRQVEDIGRMVDEFSSFARMPQPTMKPENLSEICRGAVFLEQARDSGIDFVANLPEQGVFLGCDNQQISRALANILKNATESIKGRAPAEDGSLAPGHIELTLGEEKKDDGRRITIVVRDNGLGLPVEHRERLTEPYVTTRTKGTGLGLAIVRKIMEDHNGDLVLEDRGGEGARVSLIFTAIEGNGEEDENEPLDTMEVATGILANGS